MLIDKRSILKEARAKEAAARALRETERRRQAAEQKERIAPLDDAHHNSENVRGNSSMAARKTTKAAKTAEAVVEAAKVNEETAAAAAETVKEVKKVTEEKVKKTKKAAEPKAKEVKEAAEKKTTKTVRAKKTAAKATVTIEFAGRSVSAADIQEKAVKAFKEAHEDVEVKTIDLYVQPEEGVAYYVVNGEASPEFKIEL